MGHGRTGKNKILRPLNEKRADGNNLQKSILEKMIYANKTNHELLRNPIANFHLNFHKIF